MGRRFERHLDQDLIDRMASGWTPTSATKPAKKVRTPRAAATYRGARRNEALRADVKTTWRGAKAIGIPYYGRSSKTYPYSNTRQNTRAQRAHERAAASLAA